MTTTWVRTSGLQAGSTEVHPSYPATPAANNLLVYTVTTKTGGTIGTPSGYTFAYSGSGGGFSTSVFTRRAVGNESGTVSCAITSGANSLGVITEFTASSGLASLITAIFAADTSNAADGMRATFAAQAVLTNDLVYCEKNVIDTTPQAAPIWTTYSLTIQSGGGTLGTKTAHAGTSWGTGSTSHWGNMDYPVTAGGTPVIQYQSNTTTVNLQGLVTLMVLRDVASNVPPTAAAGIDQTTAASPASVTLNGTGSSDSDGTIASYAWSQISGTTVSLNNADTATATFVPPTATGDLVFRLTVTDNLGATGTDDITVHVTAAGSVTVKNPPMFVWTGTVWQQVVNVLTWNGIHWV